MANTLKIKRGTAATIPQGQLAEPLFTTDTYDLYIGKGSGGNQRIQNYIASGTSSQFLKGDGSLDSNTYQTALTFSSPLVNTSGTVTINQSSGSADGYLSSTDWTTFNSKEPAITAGTTLQYYRGDKTFQTLDTAAVPENGSIYFTEPRVRATVLTGLNLSGGGTIAATDSILTAFGKVQNQISALVGGATYQGTWNASTNTPTLASGTGTKGYYYVVSVAGSTNLDGITDWKVGDWAIFNGTTWDKVDNTDAVSSVNGFTGAVNLALDNISDVSAASPTNAQLLRFNGTSSLWENWTPTFEPALTKGNLTEATSSVLTITGGTGAVIGSGTTIAVAQASGSTSGYLSSTDWTTFNNKQAALTNPVTGTGTNNYIPKFTATGSTIGDSSLYYSEGANFNEYTFGSIGTGNKFNNSNYYILSNSNASIYLQFGSNKYAQLYNLYGDVGLSVANTGVHSTFSMIYFNGTGTQYTAIYSPGGEGLRVKSDATLRLTQYTSNGFVKTSGGDGTLSVDTTSYLPLTGGTLTGALSGTSATFSGNGLFGGSTNAGNAGTYTLSVGVAGSTAGGLQLWAGTAQTSYVQFGDGTASADNYRGYVAYAHGTDSLILGTASTDRLTISSTGAATFSSSVTTGSYVFATNTLNSVNGSFLIDHPSVNTWKIGVTNTNTSTFHIGNDNGGSFATKVLNITNAGNVGIGTTSPNAKLEVFGGSAITTLANSYTNAGYLHQYNSSNLLAIGSDGTSMILQAVNATNNTSKNILLNPLGGNVGIGVTPSAWASSYAITQYKGGFVGTSAGSFMYFGQNCYSDGSFKYVANGLASNYAQDAGDHIFYTAPSGTAGNAITFTPRMTITSGGNVGIGTNSPSSYSAGNLAIVGSTTSNFGIAIDNTYTAGLSGTSSVFLYNNGSLKVRYDYSRGDDAGIIGTVASIPMWFLTGGVERMRITSGGYLKASNAGTYLNSTGTYHELRNNTAATATAVISATNASFTDNVLAVGSTRSTSTAFNHIAAYTSDFTNLVFKVAGNGDVTATAFFESSDIRLKSNIKDYKSNDILNISAKIYEKDGKIEVGYLAQDLENVLSSAISVRDNGYLDLSYRQVHTAKIAALEAKIVELEAKLK